MRSWHSFWLILHVLAVVVAFGPTFAFPLIAAFGRKHPQFAVAALHISELIEKPGNCQGAACYSGAAARGSRRSVSGVRATSTKARTSGRDAIANADLNPNSEIEAPATSGPRTKPRSPQNR